jgi:3-oxoacyl-[acyl-carrier protein] reductase
VRVNSLAPGAINTLMRADAPEATRQPIRQATPLGRMGRPEEIAADGGITACW